MSQSISKSDSVHFQEVTQLCQPLQKDGAKLSLIASTFFVVLRGMINFEPVHFGNLVYTALHDLLISSTYYLYTRLLQYSLKEHVSVNEAFILTYSFSVM